ncbi:diguanylate cyclase [Lacrimispora sp. 210928-DFI.3.58]|uniref:diguanylate cyclase n=1 Tax=Lacrimispora sp. 210928-DFI.3.58 TaxID=2883214 RepID=UPI001D0794F0|nr:diguanylate cyclase [Lacrimispora sp. 210928-DFI.3.58]MCB7318349.1 diguanylate cyclase [Lacrimispora sp. 210928-DFI.3.58]
MKKGRIGRRCHGIFIGAMVVLALLAVCKGYTVHPPVEMLASGTVTELNDKWEQSWDEDSRSMDYCYTIPESLKGDVSFVMKSYLRSFELLLDGEAFYSFQDVYGVKGGSRFVVKLPADCAGGRFVLSVKTDGQSYGQYPVIYAYLGREKEVLGKLWRDNMYALLFGACSFVAGTGLLMLASYLKRNRQRDEKSALKSLSGFMFFAGVWVVTDSGLLLCLTDQVALVNMISFVSFFIMPVYLLRFISCIWIRKPVFDICCWLFLLISVVYLLNYLHPVIPGYFLLLPDHILCFTAMGAVLKTGREQMKSQEKKEARKMFAGFAVLSLFAIVAFLIFYINPTYNYPIFYCIGIFLFYLILLDITFDALYGQMKKTASLSIYKRMAYMGSMVGMENRAAFMKIQREDPSARERAYIVMDINNLKEVNDRYGHYEGDRLIQAAASCILDVFGPLGKGYRIGGDEFVVILENSTAEEVEKALEAFQQRVQKENGQKETHCLSIAAGYALWKQESDTAEELFRRADADMYVRKQKMKLERGGFL